MAYLLWGTAVTRQEITVLCKDTMGEFLGAAGSDDPFAWDRLIDTAAADVCRATDCFSMVVDADVTANQATYCLPQLYRITGVFWTDAALKKQQLIETLPSDLDYRRIGWRNDPPGSPQFFMPMGLNEFWLYPTPDTSSLIYPYSDLVVQSVPLYNAAQLSSIARPFVSTDAGYTLRITGGAGFNTGAFTIVSVESGMATVDRPAADFLSSGGTAALSVGGLYVEGFGVPAGLWPNQSDQCPLPDRAHMCIVYRACMLRVIQKPTQENLARRPILQEEYERAKGKLGREARLFSQAANHADNQRLNPAGGYY